jgi:hypothetical protein
LIATSGGADRTEEVPEALVDLIIFRAPAVLVEPETDVIPVWARLDYRLEISGNRVSGRADDWLAR